MIAILFVLILLGICMSVDSADETITVKNDNQELLDNFSKTHDVILLNGTYYLSKDSGEAVSDGKVYVDKSVKPSITMTGRPSCTRCARNGCSYTWRTKTYLDYCPNCHHWNCLGNKYKSASVHEQEITCFHCDSDFCVNCGKEKYSYSRVYLRKP